MALDLALEPFFGVGSLALSVNVDFFSFALPPPFRALADLSEVGAFGPDFEVEEAPGLEGADCCGGGMRISSSNSGV